MKYGVVCCLVIVFVIGFTIAQAQECQTGETKTPDSCNTCRCLQGNWSCTRATCTRRKRQVSECVEGETKNVDCNKCFCAKGKFACTRKLCLSKREAIAARFNSQLTREKREVFTCTPGQTFSKECNTCTCTQDGKNAICTLKDCSSSDNTSV